MNARVHSQGVHTSSVGDVLLRIETGKSVKTQERPAHGAELGILKLSAVTWGEFRPGENKAILEGYSPGRCPRPMDGDLLISRANTRELVGAPVLVRGNHPQLLLSDKILRLVPDLERVEPRYLVLALRSAAARSHFESRAGGTSGSMTNITQDDIRSAPVPLPPLNEQRRIAEVLDRAEALRAKRRAALAQLDTLTQSIFLDLFGDPLRNTKGLEKAVLGDLLKLKSGAFLPADGMATDGRFPVLGGNGVNGFHDKYMFEEPQIVIGRVGAYCGCVHLSPPKCWVTDNALYVSECSPRLERCYLTHALGHAKLNQYASQSGQPLVSGSRIYPVQILVPALPVQQEFARRIAAVEKLKSAQGRSVSELDALFASLQHRAFRGEL